MGRGQRGRFGDCQDLCALPGAWCTCACTCQRECLCHRWCHRCRECLSSLVAAACSGFSPQRAYWCCSVEHWCRSDEPRCCSVEHWCRSDEPRCCSVGHWRCSVEPWCCSVGHWRCFVEPRRSSVERRCCSDAGLQDTCCGAAEHVMWCCVRDCPRSPAALPWLFDYPGALRP